MNLTKVIRAACAVVVLVAVGFIARHVRVAYENVRSQNTSTGYAAATTDAARWACIDRQLHALPDGTPTYIFRNPADGEGWQRLVELAVPHLRLVTAPAQAHITISVLMSGPCNGRQLVVSRPALP